MSTAYLFRGREAEELPDPGDWAPDRASRDSLLWIDVDGPEVDDAQLAAALGLDEEKLALGEVGRASFQEAAGFLDIALLAPDGVGRELASVRLLVGTSWVVSLHEKPVAALDTLRERTQGGGSTGELDGPGFVAMLLEWMLAAYEEAFEGIERDLEAIDVEAMNGAERDPEAHLERLVSLRSEVGRLRRSLFQHRVVIASLSHPGLADVGGEEGAERFAALRERFRDAVDSARDARESVFNSFDVLIARTEQRTNEIVKLLTILSFLLLPGSLVAGLLGMNFDVVIFDWSWLFWGVLGVFLTFVVATLAIARARRWL